MTLELLAVALLHLTSVVPSEADLHVVTELPVAVADAEFLPLPSAVDPELQRRLVKKLRGNPYWARLARKRCLAVGVVDLTEPARPRFAHLNGDEMMYAASLPKIAVLLAASQAIEDGRLEETPGVVADMHDMIRVSNNAAATRMIDRLTFDYIEEVVTDPRWRLFDPEHGGLWVGKRYAKKGPRRGDPLKNISHAATATQTCRFFYLLATGRLVSEAGSRRMLAALSDPGLHHKFVRSLEVRAPRARLFRKSGTWQVWHSDSVLVWGPERRYILVAMVQDERGGRIVEQIVPIVEEVLGK